MRAFGPHANRAITRPWATSPWAAARRCCAVGGRHAALPLTITARSNHSSSSSSSSSNGSSSNPVRLLLCSNPASITRAPLHSSCALPPVFQHSRGASAAEWGHLPWGSPAEGVLWKRHEGGPPPLRILAAMPTAEMCWLLCEEERGEELSANLTSRILDALRGPEGIGKKLSYKGGSLDCPAHESGCRFLVLRGWVELRAELHEALELLFEEGGALPRSLSELRIGAPGEGQAEAVVSGEEEATEGQGAASGRRRRPRSPELIFEVLSPQAFTSAAPRQQRKAAQDAFLSVVEEHFVLRPRSAEAANLDKLLRVVGPIRFLDLLPLLVQQQQAGGQQQPHEGGQQQQEHHQRQQPEQQQQGRRLQQLRSRLSPASLGALLRHLCEAQGPPLFEAPRIFAACWAAEDQQRVGQVSAAEGLAALASPLTGTGVSWRYLLDVAQRRQSEPFLLHLFECMNSYDLRRAAAAALAEKDPLTGQLLDPWGFMMSRSLIFHPDGRNMSSFVTACDGPPHGSAHQGIEDQWSSRVHAYLAPQTSPRSGEQPKASSADAHTSSASSHGGSSSGSSNTDSACSGNKSTTSSAGSTRSSISLPEGSIRFVGSASEVGECFEFLRRRQQQQTRLIMNQTELQKLFSHVGLAGEASLRSPTYELARHRRLSLRSFQAHAGEASGSGSLMTESPEQGISGDPSLSFFSPEEEGSPSSWWLRGAPHGEFLFPLEMGEECGCAALLPLSAYSAAVCRLLHWLLPNPLIVKVLFDSGDTLQRLALGPLSNQKGPPLGPLVHAIDLRQPRVHSLVGAQGNQPGPLLRDAQLAEALTRGDRALLRDVLKRQQERQQQQDQQQQEQQQQHQQQRELETETQVLTIGTRRTLGELGQAVLGVVAPDVRGRLTRSGNPNRRPLELQDLRDSANEAFSLLLIERKLRQTMLRPKSILGGSGVHALLFDKTAPRNAWLLDRSKCAAYARRKLREAMEAQDTFTC
ncbi:hypothetical protein Esti_000509 [Eimeria stiedai]